MTTDQIKSLELQQAANELAEKKRSNLANERIKEQEVIMKTATDLGSKIGSTMGKTNSGRGTQPAKTGKKPKINKGDAITVDAKFHKHNDVSWYKKQPEIFQRVTTVYSRDVNTSTIEVPGVRNTNHYNGENIFKSSLYVYPITFTIGGGSNKVAETAIDVTDSTSSVSVIFQRLYASITKDVGYTVDWTPSTLAMHQLSCLSYYTLAAECKRELRMLKFLNPWNSMYSSIIPAVYKNDSVTGLKENQGNLTADLAREIDLGNKALYIPSSITLLDRQIYLASNIFVEGSTDNSKLHIFKNVTVYLYDFKRNRLQSKAIDNLDLSAKIKLLAEMRQKIASSVPFLKVQGQFTKVFKDAPHFQMSYTDIVPELTTLEVNRDSGVLTQIHNAVFGRPYTDDSVYSWVGNYIGDGENNQPTLVDDPSSQYTEFDIWADSMDILYQGFVSAYSKGLVDMGQPVATNNTCYGISLSQPTSGAYPTVYSKTETSVQYFDTHDQFVSNDEVGYACLLTNVTLPTQEIELPIAGRNATVAGGIEKRKLYVTPVIAAGTEIMWAPRVYSLPTANNLSTHKVMHMFPTHYSMYNDNAAEASILAQSEYAPKMYFVDTSGVISGVAWKFDNLYSISNKQLSNILYTMVTSMFIG